VANPSQRPTPNLDRSFTASVFTSFLGLSTGLAGFMGAAAGHDGASLPLLLLGLLGGILVTVGATFTGILGLWLGALKYLHDFLQPHRDPWWAILIFPPAAFLLAALPFCGLGWIL